MSKFTIPKPCHENWENMLPEEKGKFCGSCQKTVYDFTQTSDEKIQQIFEKENGNICGRFEDRQLVQFSKFQNVVMRFENFTQNHLSKFGILISAVSLLMSISGCQKKIETLGEIAPAKMDGDSANCTVDSTDSQIEMGEPIMVREDTAQIQKRNMKNGFPHGIIISVKKDTSKKMKPLKPPIPVKIVEPEPIQPKLPGYPHTVGVPIAVSRDSLKSQ